MCRWARRSWLFGFALLFCMPVHAASDLATARRAYKDKDYATAFKVLTPLVKKGNADAEVLLGRMYLMGHGVLKDQDEAYKLFKMAADQGSADGEFFLGSKAVLSHVGLAEGLRWLRLSAGQGNQDAQLLLGQNYMRGLAGYLPRDPVKAEMWLTLAAKDNLPFYKMQLVDAERQMSPADIARGKALAAAWKPQHGLKPTDKP